MIARKYVIREELGNGGMATVYRADQTNLGRTVAIKVLHAALAADPALVHRFTDEARAASRLNHPHIVSIMDFGQTESGLLYIVMEHLRGTTLARVIARSAPLAPARVIAVLGQVLDALEEAHQQSVVHRDLKPENIMVESLRTGGDFAKVLDFGIAKLRPEQRTGASFGGICGTPEYMAPEQVRAQADLDGRADLYAVGVLGYEMLTGISPFAADSTMEVLDRQLHAQPPRIHEVRPEAQLPPGLEDALMKALAKDRDARFASARAMREALDACLPRRLAAQEARPAAAVTASSGRSFVFPRPEHALLRKLIGGRPGGALVLRGPDGAGKSALAEYARVLAQEQKRPCVLIGPDPTGAGRPWYPIRQLCRRLLGLRGRPTRDMIDTAIRRISQTVADLPGLALMFGIGGDFGGLELAARRRECFSSTLRVVKSAAGQNQAIVLFDDVDRFDTPSRVVVERLLADAATTSLTLLATSNAQWTPPGAVTVVDVAPLDAREVEAFARRIDDPLPPDALAEVVALGQGLPLAVEQLLRDRREGGSAPHSNLADIVAARIARLDQSARTLLQGLATAGGSADEALLAAVEVPVQPKALATLEAAGFIERDEGRFAITHPLITEVVCSGAPEEVRRSLHTAWWRYFDQRHAKAAVLAKHAFGSGEPKAIAVLELAGELAQREFDDAGGAIHYRRAMEMVRWQMMQAVPDADVAFVRISIKFGEALLYSGDAAGAEGVLREALAHTHGQPGHEARVRLALARLAGSLGRLEIAERELRAGWRVGFRTDANVLAELYLEFAGLCMRRGDLEAAVRDLDEGISLCTGGGGAETDGPDLLWRLVARQAEALLKAGERARALRVGRQALERARRAKSPAAEARVHALLAELHDALGEGGPADENRQAALTIFRRLGDRKSTAELLLADAQTSLARTRATPSADTLRDLEEAARLSAQVDWQEGVERSARVVDQVSRQSGSASPA